LGCSIQFITRPCENNDFCSQPCWLKYQTEHRLNIKEESRNRPTVIEMQKAFAKQREELVKSLTFILGVVSGVYIIINIENNMIYIGSSQDIEGRWTEHLNKLYDNRHENDHLQKAWNKYGDKAFQFKILEATEIIDLISREQYYLNLYKPYERNIGYNLFKTAYSPLGYKWTEEQKLQLKEKRIGRWSKGNHPMKGKKHSPEAKEAMSQIHLARYAKLQEEGKLPPQTGFTWSEEDRKRMSESRKGKGFPKEFGEAVRSRRLGTKLVDGHWIHP
jgi:group I intron endonuclease